MKQGIKTIQNLYGELERQREARKDLILNCNKKLHTCKKSSCINLIKLILE